jgi:hypothetical protein
MFKKRLVAIFGAMLLNTAFAEGIPTFDIKAALDHAVMLENESKSLINQAKQIQSVSGARDFVGRINKDLEEVPEEWSSMMGDIAKSNKDTELKKVGSGIDADSSQKTYLAYAQSYMAEAQKSVKNWEQLSKLQEAANEAEDLKASQDIANRIQMQLQTDRLTEKRLAAMKETSEMQRRIYAQKIGQMNACVRAARLKKDVAAADKCTIQ